VHEILVVYAGYLGALAFTFVVSRIIKLTLTKAFARRLSGKSILYITFAIAALLTFTVVKSSFLDALPAVVSIFAYKYCKCISKPGLPFSFYDS
jgi:energy-converting hydrogenase Eha subunit A